jgi:hypothetical protein
MRTSTTVPSTTTTRQTTTTIASTTTTQPTTTTTIPSPPPSGFLSDVYKNWSNGPDPTGDPSYFPTGVWLQSASRQEGGVDNAINYQNLGIQMEIGDWNGVPSADYTAIVNDHWTAVPGPGGGGTFGLDSPFVDMQTIKANAGFSSVTKEWLMYDEADLNSVNYAVNNELTPRAYAAEAATVKAADPTRPVFGPFGQDMANENWVGYQAQHESPPQTYDDAMRTYCSNVDILTADDYAYSEPPGYNGEQSRGAYTYGAEIDNMKAHCAPTKLTWGIVETGQPCSSCFTITPDQIQKAAWDMIVHGANGLEYFVHDFRTNAFTEDGLLVNEVSAQPVVKTINADLHTLAPILNSVSQPGVVVNSTTGGVPVTTMLKVYQGHSYLFAIADGNANLRDSGNTTATITVPGGFTGQASVLLGENRAVAVSGGQLTDSFGPYQVHVYQIG